MEKTNNTYNTYNTYKDEWFILWFESLEEGWNTIEDREFFSPEYLGKWELVEDVDQNTKDLYGLAIKLYYDDEHHTFSKKLAYSYFKMIADHPHNIESKSIFWIWSCYYVGWMNLNELNVGYDLKISERYLQLASECDCLDATYALGLLCYSLNPPNSSKGNEYLRIAANRGHGKAQELYSKITNNPIDKILLENKVYGNY